MDFQLDDGPQASRKWGKYFGYTVTGGGGTCTCSAQDDPREVLIFFPVKVDCDERGFGSAFRTVDRSFSSRSRTSSEFFSFFYVNFDCVKRTGRHCQPAQADFEPSTMEIGAMVRHVCRCDTNVIHSR